MSIFDKQEITNLIANSSVVIQANGNVEFDAELLNVLLESRSNIKLLNRLIAEKLQYCKEQILTKNLSELRRTISTFLNYGVNGIEDKYKKCIRFYQFILAIFEKNETSIEELMDVLDESYFSRAEKIIAFKKNPMEVEAEAWSLLESEDQILMLDIMFDNAMYESIVSLYRACGNNKYEIKEFLKYYYALSLYNIRQYEAALGVLKDVDRNYKADKIKLLIALCDAEVEIIKYDEQPSTPDRLDEIMNCFRDIKKEFPTALLGAELLVALAEVRIALLIHIDTFLDVFYSIESKIQQTPVLQYYLGYYYELCNDLNKAAEVYLGTEWKTDNNILYRLLICFLSLERYEELCSYYEDAGVLCRVPKTTGIYITAINYINEEQYEELLRNEVNNNANDADSLFYFSLAIQDNKLLFDELLLDKIIAWLDEISQLDSYMSINIAMDLLAYGYVEICLQLLEKIENISISSQPLLYEFYKRLYMYKRDEINACENLLLSKELSETIQIKLQIANWFIERDLAKELFLRIVIEAYQVLGREAATLKSLKSLYECTHDEMDAVNIIAYLSQRAGYEEEYSYYIEQLKDSTTPKTLLAIAVAYHRIGKSDMAEYSAYKSLYFLKDDNFEIYNGYLYLMNEMIYDRKNQVVELGCVVDNCVIKAASTNGNIYLCLDKEIELEPRAKENESLGAQHFSSRDRMYLMLRNKKKGDTFSWNNIEYKILEIISREVFCYRYVLDKCVKNPEHSQVYMISMEKEDVNIDNLWKKMTEEISKYENTKGKFDLSGRKQVNDLLELYHFSVNELGLPIETICHGDYSRYVDVIRLLLFGKDQALYAGTADVDCGVEKRYVLSISTLILLCVIGEESLLKKYIEKILVPKSLTEFVYIQVKKLTELQAISPGVLIELDDGSHTMLPFDTTVVDIWSKAYELCMLFEQVEIDADEREKMSIVDGFSAESLFSMLQLDKYQIDCFVLTQKCEQAILLCDDLFYRKMANAMGVHNTNFTNLIYLLEDKSEATRICFELSKTNYLYVPFIFETSEQMSSLFENLLEGKRKNKYYRPMINHLVENAWKRIWE